MATEPFAEARNGQNRKPGQKRLLVVEDHPIVREGLQRLFEAERDLCVCAQTGDARQVLRTAADAKPDLVIMDISLPNGNGLELVKDLRARHPKLPVLVFSVHDEMVYAERALRAGAMAYVRKDCPGDELLDAIRRVLGGKPYVSSELADRLVLQLVKVKGEADGPQASEEPLSDRELEVLDLLGTGLRPREIAGQLHVSVKTVESYFARMKRKLGLPNAAELARYAIRWVHSAESP